MFGVKSIEKLVLLSEIVDSGSFTAAADKLGVSKGYLSQQVSQLEKQLKTQLLFRTTRKLQLTTAGDILLKQVPKLRAFCYETESRLLSLNHDSSGLLRIAAPQALAVNILSGVFDDFQQTYPDLSIQLITGNTPENLVESGFDLAIRITDAPPENMVAKKLMAIHYICCATPQYLDEKGTPQSPDDLKKHNCLALSHWSDWMFYAEDKIFKIAVEGNFSATDNQLLKQAGLNHRGIIRLPHYLIEKELTSGTLCRLLPGFQPERRALQLIYPPMINRPQKSRLCIDYLLQHFQIVV